MLKNKNFAKSKLASGITSTETSLTVTTAEGSNFPSAGNFRAVIWGAQYASPADDPTREIVTATLSSGDAFTITRAQEDTSAKAWSTGDNFALVITAGKIDEIEARLVPSTLTPGSVLFVGTGGVISQDNAQLFWDNTNKRLGIGTTAPGEKLAVAGNMLLGTGNTNALKFTNIHSAAPAYIWSVSGNASYADMSFNINNGGTDQTTLRLNYQGFIGLGGPITDATLAGAQVVIKSGNVGIGTTSPSYKLQLSTDSAAKPTTNTWTVSSDERLKENIIPADLERCYEIVKTIPLKRFTWKGEAYTPEQVADRSKLGWIAQDVQPLFKKAVNTHKFEGTPVEDGVEEYQEQDYTVEMVEVEKKEIEIRDGKPVQVTKLVQEERKTLLFDNVEVVDEQGNVVMKEDGTPLTHQMPRMITKTRPKFKPSMVIEDALGMNADQIYAAMYGAVQMLMAKVEELEKKIVSV